MKMSRRVLYILLPVMVLALVGTFLSGCVPPGTMPPACQKWYDKGNQEGYNIGFTEGYNKGKQEGMVTGYNEGYAKGLADGKQACPDCPKCPECPQYQFPYYFYQYPSLYPYPYPRPWPGPYPPFPE